MSEGSLPEKKRWLKRIRNRLQFGFFLKSFVDWAVIFCMVAGCLFLATKLFWSDLWPNMLWVLLAAFPVLVTAWWYSRRNQFGDEQSVALLDRQIGAGGLLMTVVESPDDQWERHLPAAEQIWKKAIPALRPFRALKHLALPLLFLAVTCLIPARTVQSLGLNPSTVSRTEVSRLNEMLKELEETDVLKEEEKDEIEEQIRKLEKETKYSPLTHENWETVDALQQKMELKLASRENQLQQAASALAAFRQSLSESSSTAEADKERLRTLLQDLASRQSTQQNGNRSDRAGLDADLSRFKDSSGNINLPSDPEALQEALDALGDFIETQCQGVGMAREKLDPCDCDGCKEGGT